MRKYVPISIAARRGERAFTLIELLTVMAIIAVLVGITVPAIKSLAKSNDRSQATNMVESYIGSARGIAIAQHRMAGVVFFEETIKFSNPTDPAKAATQTAMQIFVEDYNQVQYSPPTGVTYFIAYSAQRQYLPAGIKLAGLNGTNNNSSVSAAENTTDTNYLTRAILFDANGQLLLRDGMAAPTPTGTAGIYPMAYGDWQFGNAPRVTDASSSPGFFLYSKSDFDSQQPFASDAAIANWLHNNSDVVMVNNYTGNVIR